MMVSEKNENPFIKSLSGGEDMLLDFIEEGFCIIKVLFDEKEHPTDFQFIETNEVFEQHINLKEVKGKRIKKLKPDYDDFWIKRLGEVVTTGKFARLERPLISIGSFGEGCAFHVGKLSDNYVAMILKVVTESEKQEQRLNQALRAAAMGSWHANLSTGKLTRDAHLNHLFGNEAKESTLKIEEGLQAIYFKDRSAVRIAWKKAIKTESFYKSEFRVIHKDKSVHWFREEGQFLKGENGKPDTLTGLTSDITRQKRMEKNLWNYKAQHQLLIEQADDFAIVILDVEGQITDWNKGAEKIFGWSKKEVMGKSGEILFTKEAREHHIPELEIKKSIKTGNANDQRWMLKKDGSKFWANGTMHSLKDERGNLSGLFKILQDETARKVTEIALHQSEENYRLIVNQTIVGIMKIDLSGNIIFANNRIAKMLDYSSHELLRMNIGRLIHEGDQSRNETLFKRMLAKGTPYEIKKRLYRKDGSYLWVNNQISPVFEKEEKLPSSVIIISVDISRQRALEKQKDSFISVASHELKTPLTGIKAYTELLEEKILKDEKEFSVTLTKKLNAQVDRLNRLIYALLDTTRITEGKLTLQKEKFDLNSFIRERVAELQLTAPDHQMIIKTNKIFPIVGDKERIAQVLTNLISNAIKYSPKGNKIIISTKDIHHEKVQVNVRDFGKGIPSDMQQKVFTRFSRLEDSKKISGFGLGLYISMEIMKEHGGMLGVESPPSQENEQVMRDDERGVGSLFYFILPYRN